MRKYDIFGVAICLTSLAALTYESDLGTTWYVLWVSIFTVALISIAFVGRPSNPSSLPWDIGMSDDDMPKGTHIPVRKERNPHNNSMQRLAHQY